MIKREYWQTKIEKAWQARSVIWLSGVRRAGKTYLAQSLDNVEYFDEEIGLEGCDEIVDDLHPFILTCN